MNEVVEDFVSGLILILEEELDEASVKAVEGVGQLVGDSLRVDSIVGLVDNVELKDGPDTVDPSLDVTADLEVGHWEEVSEDDLLSGHVETGVLNGSLDLSGPLELLADNWVVVLDLVNDGLVVIVALGGVGFTAEDTGLGEHLGDDPLVPLVDHAVVLHLLPEGTVISHGLTIESISDSVDLNKEDIEEGSEVE